MQENIDYYYENGRMVLTMLFLKKRNACCRNGCRHCPYGVGQGLADPPKVGENAALRLDGIGHQKDTRADLRQG
jgi:hypothetical protein